jgi:hypothetical protein
MTLEDLYQLFMDHQLIPDMESLDVIQTVEEYKQYWKPVEVKTILLAESHVFTSEEDFSVKIADDFVIDPAQPRNFVRYVYCLAYGENSILEETVNNNPGTWQYWELFYSCNNYIETIEQFSPVLKKGNRVLENRINSKYNTLKQLKELGVWLIDVCPFALYSNNRGNNLRQNYNIVLDLCWEFFIRGQIVSANPKDIKVIGHNVYNALSNNLTQLSIDLGIHVHKFFQPQAHLPAEEHLHQYQEYYRNCHQE